MKKKILFIFLIAILSFYGLFPTTLKGEIIPQARASPLESQCIDLEAYKNLTYDYFKLNQSFADIILRNNELNSEIKKILSANKKIVEEKDFWKSETDKLGSQIDLCKHHPTFIPKKSLAIKKICKSCSSFLYCTGSMMPTLDCNDTIHAYTNVEPEEIGICDIIGFETLEHKEFAFVIHRIVGINESGYITRGDSNVALDEYAVKFDDIQFKVIGIMYG